MGRFLDVLDLKLMAPAAGVTPGTGLAGCVRDGDVVDFQREMLVA